METLGESARQEDSKLDCYDIALREKQAAEVLKGYRGATHACNSAIAATAECIEDVRLMGERVDAVEKQRTEDHAEIARLRLQGEEMEKSFRELVKKVDELIARCAAKFKELAGEDKT